VRRLSELDHEGVAGRELMRLDEAGLRWAAPLRLEDRALGLLFFGQREQVGDLEIAEEQTLQVLLEASAVAVRNLERVEDLRDLAISALQGLVVAGEIRRPEDRGHAERVARSATELARALSLRPDERRDLVLGALLHDVGKLGTPSGSAAEGDEKKRERLHPVLGSRILSRAKPSAGVLQGVEQHHERYDGHGFPYGLRGAEMAPFGRMLAILDAFDHWTVTDQTPLDEALRRLELGAGLLFDPGIVAVFSAEVARKPPGGPDIDADWLEDIVASP
jgi:putative nucleotidyltransferase with HDIG domain